jgi:CxxC motif-containing protein (DUF1111 family)
MDTPSERPRSSSFFHKLLDWAQRKALHLGFLVAFVALVGLVSYILNNQPVSLPKTEMGGPIQGLTPVQLQKFYEAEKIFKHEFTEEEGLGPLFNGKSCFECHGQPSVVGREGRDTSSTSIMVFARRMPNTPKASRPLAEVIQGLTARDVDTYLDHGGPTLQRRSLTTEFPDRWPFDLQLDFERLPITAELQSNRHTPPIFGDGLIDNIADGDILNTMLEQSRNPKMAGRPLGQVDRFLEMPRIGHFGWKCQQPNLISFTATAMSVEMGLTTYIMHTENSPTFLGQLPEPLLRRLPKGVNDKGKILLSLTYFQSLIAPPPRGEITEQVKKGEKIFTRLQCAFCHKPDARTIPNARVPDPDSPIPNIRYMEVAALSNKVFHPYSDFLLHDMGLELADGIPQEGAKGGEWRTTPLWGLRFKKFLLHDGRTKSIHEAIMAHGGQAEDVRNEYAKLSKEDNEALMAFLKSL